MSFAPQGAPGGRVFWKGSSPSVYPVLIAFECIAVLPPSGMVFFCSSTLLFYIPWCFRLAEDCLLLVVQLEDLCTNLFAGPTASYLPGEEVISTKSLLDIELQLLMLWIQLSSDKVSPMTFHQCTILLTGGNYFYKVNFRCDSVITSCNDTAVTYL